jgi:hypothetical protein
MLIGLIIAILFGTSGGPESEFVSSIPHLQREIRKNVTDGARKEELLALVKAYEKTIKKSQKEGRKLKKRADKAAADRNVSRNEFLREYDYYYNSRERLLASLIGYRLLFQEQITEEELLLIYENAIFTSKKERRKDNKQNEKAEEKLHKFFEDINDIVVKHIDDPKKTELIAGYLNDFKNTVFAFVDDAHDLNIQRHIMLDNKNATRKELEALYERSSQLRFRASREYAKMREEIIRNTNEREWKAINKELKVFLKS